MAAPLMFSFSGEDSSSATEATSNSVTMRIGNRIHPNGQPQFCRRFYLQPASTVRRLRVAPEDARRVDLTYIIGIDVRIGKGRYRDTHIVTLSPRFQIHNQSQYKIQVAQSCYATTFQDPEAEASHLQVYPKSNLAFHWPRLDLDCLLRIRLIDMPIMSGCGMSSTFKHAPGASKNITNVSHWSGAFLIGIVCTYIHCIIGNLVSYSTVGDYHHSHILFQIKWTRFMSLCEVLMTVVGAHLFALKWV